MLEKAFKVRLCWAWVLCSEPDEAQRLLAKDPRNRDVIFPYLNGEDLNSRWDQSASRWVINFRDWPLERAMEYADCFEFVERLVKPERTRKGKWGFQLRYPLHERWWQYGGEARLILYAAIAGLERVMVRSRIANTSVFCARADGPYCLFADKLVVFASDRWGVFGSRFSPRSRSRGHATYSSTLRTRHAVLTLGTAFETFPFPVITSRSI